MDEQARRWPVDYDAIEKGDVINEERLAEITGEEPGTTLFQGGVFLFRNELQRQLWIREKPYTVRQAGNEIHVLDDADSSQYNSYRFEAGIRSASKAHRRMLAVDVAKLDPDERRKHDRNALVQGAVLASLIPARRAALARAKEPLALPEE